MPRNQDLFVVCYAYSLHDTRLSARTSLYLLSFILQEVHFKGLVKSIRVALLYPHMAYDIHLDGGWNGDEFA